MKIYALLNDCFKHATIKDEIAKNPMLIVKLQSPQNFKKNVKAAEKYFTQDEKAVLIQECKRCYKNGSPVFRFGYAYILMLHTGLRPGEVLALDKNEDVDLEPPRKRR